MLDSSLHDHTWHARKWGLKGSRGMRLTSGSRGSNPGNGQTLRRSRSRLNIRLWSIRYPCTFPHVPRHTRERRMPSHTGHRHTRRTPLLQSQPSQEATRRRPGYLLGGLHGLLAINRDWVAGQVAHFVEAAILAHGTPVDLACTPPGCPTRVTGTIDRASGAVQGVILPCEPIATHYLGLLMFTWHARIRGARCGGRKDGHVECPSHDIGVPYHTRPSPGATLYDVAPSHGTAHAVARP